MPRKTDLNKALQGEAMLKLIADELGLTDLSYVPRFKGPSVYLLVAVITIADKRRPAYYIGSTNGSRPHYAGSGRSLAEFKAKYGQAFLLRYVIRDFSGFTGSLEALEAAIKQEENQWLRHFKVRTNTRFFNTREDEAFTLEERRRAGKAVQRVLKSAGRAFYDPAVQAKGNAASVARQRINPVPRNLDACARGGRAAQARFRAEGEHFFDPLFQRKNGLNSAAKARQRGTGRFDRVKQQALGRRGAAAALAKGVSMKDSAHQAHCQAKANQTKQLLREFCKANGIAKPGKAFKHVDRTQFKAWCRQR